MPPRRGTINFTGGPSKIPETVLRRAQQEMVDFEDTGISVLEVDHHSVEFINFTKRLEEKITNLLKIPNNYTLLFMPGCIETQYEAIALNLGRLIKGTISANYLMTGYSSEAAYAAACKYFTPYVVNPDIQPYTNIPSLNELKLRPNSSYFFYVAADAVTGLDASEMELPPNEIIVADLSGTLLSRPVNIENHALIVSETQNNLGIAGLCLVIIRNDLLKLKTIKDIPAVFDYRNYAFSSPHVFNTPSVWNLYMTSLMIDWIEEKGLQNIFEENKRKVALIYDVLDDTFPFYLYIIDKPWRSEHSIQFIIPNKEGNPRLEPFFLKGAERRSIYGLITPHESVKEIHILVTIVNSHTLEEVQKLCNYMMEFYRIFQT